MARKPLIGLTVSVEKRLTSALKESAKLLQGRMIKNASLTDHTLDELRKLGHPYSVRNPRNIHRPAFKVHAQSGRLSDNIEAVKVKPTKYFVGVDQAKVPYIGHVIIGTRFMVARDFIFGSFKEVQKDLSKIIRKSVRNATRRAKSR